VGYAYRFGLYSVTIEPKPADPGGPIFGTTSFDARSGDCWVLWPRPGGGTTLQRVREITLPADPTDHFDRYWAWATPEASALRQGSR
jgi:hypothetical protein